MRRPAGERGSVIVEFGFVLPFLVFMAFGILEFGLAFQGRTTVQAATRSGLRVGSAAGKTVDADKNLLLGMSAVLTTVGLSNVNAVLIYKSATADGVVPATCTDPVKSVSATCNLYTGAQLQQLSAGTAPASWFGCGATALDRFWCPTGRESLQANGTDYLGVWIQVQHHLLTGFYGSTLTITDSGVMRLEPQSG